MVFQLVRESSQAVQVGITPSKHPIWPKRRALRRPNGASPQREGMLTSRARQHLSRCFRSYWYDRIDESFRRVCTAADRYFGDGAARFGHQFGISDKRPLPGAAGMFFLNNVPGPYDSQIFAHAIADPSMRRDTAAQRCWLSVDLIHKASNNEKAYRFIERVLAEIRAGGCGLSRPSFNSSSRSVLMTIFASPRQS